MAGGRRRGRFAGKDEEHGGVIEKIARTGDGEFLRSSDLESNRLPFAHRPNAEPPRFDVDALIPKAGLSRGNGDGDGASDVEVDEVIAGGGVSDVHGLVVDRNREGG